MQLLNVLLRLVNVSDSWDITAAPPVNYSIPLKYSIPPNYGIPPNYSIPTISQSASSITTTPEPLRNPNLLYVLWPSMQNPYRFNCSVVSHLMRTKNCHMPGLVAESQSYIMKSAGFDYKVFRSPLGNLTIQDQMDVMNKSDEFDLVIESLTPTVARQKYFRFSYPIGSLVEIMAAVTATSPDTDWWVSALELSTIFRWDVWCMILILSLVYLFYVKILAEVSAIRGRPVYSGIAWCAFFLASFGSLFQGGLLASLLKTNTAHRFTNLAELAVLVSSGALKVATSPGIVWYEELKLQAKSTTEKDFWAALQSNPPLWVSGPEHLGPDIKSGRVVYIHVALNAYSWAQQFGSCEVIQLPELGTYQNSMMFGKHISDWAINRLNEAISSGNSVFQAILLRYEHELNHQLEVANSALTMVKAGQPKPFQIQNLLGVFIILLVGSVIAAFICISEWLMPILRKSDHPLYY